MKDGYSLSRRRIVVMRLASLAFFFAAAVIATGCAVGAAFPGIHVTCESTGCTRTAEPWRIAPDSEQAAIETSPAARARFVRYLDRPLVRAGFAAVTAFQYLPLVLLTAAVAMALRRLAASAPSGVAATPDPLARALPWLRRAAAAAVLLVLVGPVGDSLYVMLLYPGTPIGPRIEIPLDVVAIARGLLLATGAYAVVWAIDAGSRAQRDLAEFV